MWDQMKNYVSYSLPYKQERGKDEHILKIWDQMKTTWFYSLSLNTHNQQTHLMNIPDK